MTPRRITVRRLAAPGILAARELYTGCPVDVLRVAALVEISAAAATLARTVVRLRRMDPATITPHVADPTDARAVLGRGQWLPTMTKHVPAPPRGRRTRTRKAPAVSASVRRRDARRAGALAQLPPRPANTGGGR
ncbi:hypothetical protein ACTMTJ_29080 [Phytohabitans sp. LJ34]|uniref:hypothetical protein n=1 Tax=Phytohabitans sp. LJ34 TaxID=3452217 RepID=UPI003F8A777E